MTRPSTWPLLGFALTVAGGLAACGDDFQPVCGDLLISPAGDEQCDDGNTVGGDGCSAMCRLELPSACGNGAIDDGEVCDDGNLLSGDGCSGNCLSQEVCGNGFRDFGEACDDGDTDDGDGCSSTCALEAICGNGVIEPGEACDDGNASDLDGCLTSCVPASCGDGFVQAGVEACDDGNLDDDDACGSTCEPCLAGNGQRQSVQARGRCYLEFDTPAAWLDAEAACTALGGHLASVASLDENARLRGLSTELPYWLGANDRDLEGALAWSDGSSAFFRRWAVGAPDDDDVTDPAGEDCVRLEPDGTWDDRSCLAEEAYVCEVVLAPFAPLSGATGAGWTAATTPAAAPASLVSYHDGVGAVYNLDGSSSTTGERYDLVADAWTALSQPLVDDASAGLQAAPWAGGLYLVRHGAVRRFDLATETWSTVATYGERADDGSMTEADGQGRVYAVEDGWLITYDAVTGALDEWDLGLGATPDVRLAYDPAAHALFVGLAAAPAFARLDLGTRALVPTAPSPEGALGAAVCADRSGHGYATGGVAGVTAWQYDVATDAWTALPDLPFDHGAAGACTVSAAGVLLLSDGVDDLARLDLE
ncbi:MAG: DUF4215 domain-containing protein [Kofleriaceae bacterium]